MSRKNIVKKKMLMITTGGTIASVDTETGLLPKKIGSDLFRGVREELDTDILDLYSIDSTDAAPEHWRRLYRAVTENLDKYDCFLILHGTDTMAYTGAVLSFTLKTEKPVILTGSMLPPDDKDTDAFDNLGYAMFKAYRAAEKGVHLVFANGEEGGADIIKTSCTDIHAFSSYSGYKPDRYFDFPEKDGEFPAVIKLTPFTKETDLDDIKACGAVIETYGAGGIPERLAGALERLCKRMPAVITTPCRGGVQLDKYEVGRRAINAGAVSSNGMSTECAAVRMWLEISEKSGNK